MKNIIIGFIRKEFAQTLRDPVMRLFLFGAPIMQLILFGFAISNDFRNIKIAVCAHPHDRLIRQLADRFFASRYFISADASGMDSFELLRSGRADGVIIASREPVDRSAEREEGKLQFLIDAVNAVKARAVDAYAQSILRIFLRDIEGAGTRVSRVSFNARILYNPALITAYFMVPGVMTMIIGLATIMLTSMSITREKEMGTIETIIASPVGKISIIMGKSVPFVVIGVFDALLVIGAGVLIFDVPIRGSLILLLLSCIIFVCATVSVGILISTLASNQQQAMMGAFMFLFPAFLMSGVVFPVENMPGIIRFAAYLDPLKYFVAILRSIMLKGAHPYLILPDLGILMVMTLGIMYVATRRFSQTLN